MTLIPKQTGNRLGTQRSCLLPSSIPFHTCDDQIKQVFFIFNTRELLSEYKRLTSLNPNGIYQRKSRCTTPRLYVKLGCKPKHTTLCGLLLNNQMLRCNHKKMSNFIWEMVKYMLPHASFWIRPVNKGLI